MNLDCSALYALYDAADCLLADVEDTEESNAEAEPLVVEPVGFPYVDLDEELCVEDDEVELDPGFPYVDFEDDVEDDGYDEDDEPELDPGLLYVDFEDDVEDDGYDEDDEPELDPGLLYVDFEEDVEDELEPDLLEEELDPKMPPPLRLPKMEDDDDPRL